MANSYNLSPHLPFVPQTSNDHGAFLEALALTEAITTLKAHLPKEGQTQEPLDLRNRSVKATEHPVVQYTKAQLETKKKLCHRGNNATLEREKRYFQTPSAETLSHLLDQFQVTYAKFWELQEVVEARPESMPKSLLNIADDLEQFENHTIDFLLSCMPSDPEQIQDLFLMAIWLQWTKNSKREVESANYVLTSKRILSFFENDKMANIPLAKMNHRVICCDLKSQKMEPFDEDLLPTFIITSITNSLKYILFFRDTETIKANIIEFVYDSELFKRKQDTQQLLAKSLTIAELCESAFNLVNKLKCSNLAIIPGSTDIPDLNPNSLLFYVFRFGENGQLAYNSPDISLSALEQLIRFLQIPEFKKKVLPLIEKFASTEIDLPVLNTICNFLINQDTFHLIDIPNKDSRLYLSAVLYYLKNEPEKAASELLKSRVPEARWLLSKVYEQSNRLEEAIHHSRLAIQQGISAANLQLALLLIKNSKNDLGSIEEVITLLQRAIEHYDFIDAKDVSFYIQGIIDELELSETKPLALEATSDEMTSDEIKGSRKQRRRPGSTRKEKTTKIPGKKRFQRSVPRDLKDQKPSPGEDQCSINASPVRSTSIEETPIQRESIKSIPRIRLSYISLSVTQLLHNSDFEQARTVLEHFCQETQLTIQQASFAHMDLWSLRVIAKGSEHLEAFNASAKQEQKSGELNILAQSGKALTDYGLDRKACGTVLLSDDIPKTQLAIRKLIIDKALGWLCCLHPRDQTLVDYKAQWIIQPCAIARHHLAEFEHSLSLTFVTGSFLSLIGHIHGDMASDCDDQKRKTGSNKNRGNFIARPMSLIVGEFD
ncbi:hypothetical protein [Endozoicomonas sp. GU-1]|uniref:tetratricopeptide repeat protein n=1 Tax=Endozoicomonas sp. GU-1 TaxID=3009078 RepID=UPI0022B39A39|nr:hypothetical protein [Endozoicomonas sp. GU-1]WBA82767.1 hypothetical protein O2T12_06465 [Endozoicomonas sp. GU-1]